MLTIFEAKITPGPARDADIAIEVDELRRDLCRTTINHVGLGGKSIYLNIDQVDALIWALQSAKKHMVAFIG